MHLISYRLYNRARIQAAQAVMRSTTPRNQKRVRGVVAKAAGLARDARTRSGIFRRDEKARARA